MQIVWRSTATVAVLLGIAAGIYAYFGDDPSQLSTQDFQIAGGLLLAGVLCGRFPIRMGMSETYLTLDSVPILLAVVMLPMWIAILVSVLSIMIALFSQPSYPGWLGPFWRIHAYATTALSVGIASACANWLVDDGTEARLVTAMILAFVLELSFELNVLNEIASEDPAQIKDISRSGGVFGANIVLPGFGVAVLAPYADDPVIFLSLLGVVLFMFWGAMWVANSQQLEKRRGDKLKDTFSRYVPEGIVDDNIETMQDIELGGEQADLSVLFCDIRGFTSWSEDKGATEVITELNVLLTELSASVMETGGTLDKFTGDGLMAFWGAPVTMEDHADRASRAALDMLGRLEMVNARRQESGQEPFAIGVAVHSGTAVVGNVGHERRLDYTAIGDTVNTTARLEASTKELGAVLLVSRSTVDLLCDDLRSRAMRIGDVTMKGKARPVEAWALQPLRPDLDGVDDEFAA